MVQPNIRRWGIFSCPLVYNSFSCDKPRCVDIFGTGMCGNGSDGIVSCPIVYNGFSREMPRRVEFFARECSLIWERHQTTNIEQYSSESESVSGRLLYQIYQNNTIYRIKHYAMVFIMHFGLKYQYLKPSF